MGETSNEVRRRRLEAFLADLRMKCMAAGLPRRYAFSLSTAALLEYWLRVDCVRLGAPSDLVATTSAAGGGLRILHEQLVEQRLEEREGTLRHLMQQPPVSDKAA